MDCEIKLNLSCFVGRYSYESNFLYLGIYSQFKKFEISSEFVYLFKFVLV